MSTTATDLETMEQARQRRVKQDVRMRAINRLRRLNTMMSQYSRHIVAKFVDDETVSIERFRLLVVLAGFPVNALFAQDDNQAVPCTTKVDIAERMKRVDGVGEMSGVVGSGGKQMGGERTWMIGTHQKQTHKTRGGTHYITGSEVYVDVSGRSSFRKEFKGTITKWDPNTKLYSIRYENGRTDENVPHENIHKIKSAPLEQLESFFHKLHGTKAHILDIGNEISHQTGLSSATSLVTNNLKGLFTKSHEYAKGKNLETEFGIATQIGKALLYFFLLIIVNRLLFRLPSKTLSFLLFGASSKRPPALSYDDIHALPLRPGWEMRETTKGKIYFFHKPSKRVDARIPVLSDEVPHNWVEWIVPKTNESEYENLQTNVTLEGNDAYDAVQDDITNGELKRGWIESIDSKGRHHWHPPVQSPYKAESYSDRPLDKPRLEKKYGVMAWEHWAFKRRGYESGEVRYQFLRDADTDLYFQSLADVERECRRRARGEGTQSTPAFATSGPLPKSKSAENMADVQHEMDQLFTFTNVFALRVALVTGAGALALPFALRKYGKFIDNRTFAKVLEAPEGKPVSVAKDLRVPKQTTYQHTLAHIDYDLHLKFLECGNDVGMLRSRLLRMRKAREAFHQRRLLPYHLIRTNGEVRESPHEIALAIAHHWQWGNLLGIVTTRTRTAYRQAFGKRPSAATHTTRCRSGSRRQSGSRRRSTTNSSRLPSAAAVRVSSNRRRTIGGGRSLSRRIIRR